MKPGIPFSLVATTAADPVGWLRDLGMRAAALREARPEMPAQMSARLVDAERWAALALRAIEHNAEGAAGAAMCALQAAWEVEVGIGAAPFLIRDKRRQAGTKMERRPKITKWIDSQLDREPTAKSPELWKAAPDWITEQIGERRFADRVTACRKKRASK